MSRRSAGEGDIHVLQQATQQCCLTNAVLTENGDPRSCFNGDVQILKQRTFVKTFYDPRPMREISLVIHRPI